MKDDGILLQNDCPPPRRRQRKRNIERWELEIGVVLAVCRASMARQCLPRPDRREQFIVSGGAGDGLAANILSWPIEEPAWVVEDM